MEREGGFYEKNWADENGRDVPDVQEITKKLTDSFKCRHDDIFYL